MVQIPCGNKPSMYGNRCREETLCPNCTALRGLMAVCEGAADRLEMVPVKAMDRCVLDRMVGETINNLRAALAAARPAEDSP